MCWARQQFLISLLDHQFHYQLQYLTSRSTINRLGVISYFARPILDFKTQKKLYIHNSKTLDLDWPSGCAPNWFSIHECGLHFDLIRQPTDDIFLFIYLVCALPLSRSIYGRVYKVQKLDEIVNKTIKLGFSQWW